MDSLLGEADNSTRPRKEILSFFKIAGKKNNPETVSLQTGNSAAPEAVELLRNNSIKVIYDRSKSPDTFTALKKDMKKVDRLLTTAYISYKYV